MCIIIIINNNNNNNNNKNNNENTIVKAKICHSSNYFHLINLYFYLNKWNYIVLGYFFFTPNFIWVPPIYTTNELLGFLKYFLLYYSINHKYFISTAYQYASGTNFRRVLLWVQRVEGGVRLD